MHSVAPLKFAEVAVIGMAAATTTARGIDALGTRSATFPEYGLERACVPQVVVRRGLSGSLTPPSVGWSDRILEHRFSHRQLRIGHGRPLGGGKIPDTSRWQDRASLDDLMTESALQSFTKDQAAFDDRIRKIAAEA